MLEYKVVHCREYNAPSAFTQDGVYRDGDHIEQCYNETYRRQAAFVEALIMEHVVGGWRLHTALQRGGTCDPLMLIFEREAGSLST